MHAALDVSFVLVNYNSESYTRRCLESIFACTKKISFEVLVVDNGSGLDGQKLKRDFPVRVFLSEKNLGFGAANNAASRQALGRYYFFLNNDCRLLGDAAGVLFDWMEAHPQTGICGPQIVEPDGRKMISFDYFPTVASKLLGVEVLRQFHLGRFPRKDGSVVTPTEVDLITGAAMFVRAQTFQALGGFDPQFFLYCEEEDLAMRCWRLGQKVHFVPGSQIHHAGGGSSSERVALKREFYISFFRFYKKHYGLLRWHFIRFFSKTQIFWRYWARGKKEEWKTLLEWFARGAPESESLRYAPGNEASTEEKSLMEFSDRL